MGCRDLDLPRYLSTLPLFEGLGQPAWARLAQACRLQRLTRHDMVFRAGEPCPTLPVVMTGQVKLYAASSAGQEKVIELVGPGTCVEQAPLFTGTPHLVHAQALSDTLLIMVAKEAVVEEIGSDPRFALRMLGSVSQRLDGLMQHVQADALHSGPRRVADFLLRQRRHADRDCAAATVSLQASKATIASLLSVTPEYLSRVLRTLEAQALIRMDRRDIRILDATGLSAYCPAAGARAAGRRPRQAPGVHLC